jgi:CRP-like cAMP-binding protein
MDFTLRDMMVYVQKNFEFIIKNDKSDKMIEFIKLYFPVCVKTVRKGRLVFNPEIAADILYADFDNKYLVPHNGIFPSFKEKNKDGEMVEIMKTFALDILNPVAEGTNGQAFGELALINDKPRSATIICLEDTHFAILEKGDFKKIMEKSIRSKFSAKVQFLSGFPFLTGMTRIAKTKL